jgi:hypothetical protein
MKYADGMGSGAMIYTPSFIKIGSGIQKLMGWDSQTRRRTDTQFTDSQTYRHTDSMGIA